MPWNEPQERLERSERIRAVAAEFAEVAQRHGKTIISEAFLPRGAPRTLTPLSGDSVGVAGGAKYLVDGIFFKFAVDTYGLYGGDEFAMKAAGHELLGMTEYFNCSIPGLHFPLIAVIDFCGFRLTATSQLPIAGAATLCYGSADGGTTVQATDPAATELMQQAAKILNLKPHFVGVGATRKLIHAPCDIEVHRGNDGRLYVLDTARVFPPERPIRSRPGSHLYRLLRPELVRGFRVPLSPDAYTRFGGDDNRTLQHNEEVRQAQAQMLYEAIPSVVMSLNQRLKRITAAAMPATVSNLELAEKIRLVDEIHREGINCRYLVMLKKCDGVSPDPRLCVLINTEIAARKVKRRLREFLRMSLRKMQVFSPQRQDARQRLQAATATATTTESTRIPEGPPVDMNDLVEEINVLLCVVELQSLETEGVDMQLLVMRLQAMLGLRLAEGAAERVSKGELLTAADVSELCPRVRYASTVPYAEGVALYQQAQSRTGAEADAMLRVAEEKFSRALESQPDGFHILTHWGILLVERAKLAAGMDNAAQRDELLEAAIEKFAEAVSIRRNNHYALSHWAEALQWWASVREKSGDAEGAAALRARAEQKFRESDLFGKRWFFGTLPTNGLQGLLALRGHCPPGTRGVFFVRSSYSRPGHFVFSVLQRDASGKDAVRNILIRETADGRYALASESSRLFDSLEDLVAAKTHEGFQPILRDWCSDT